MSNSNNSNHFRPNSTFSNLTTFTNSLSNEGLYNQIHQENYYPCDRIKKIIEQIKAGNIDINRHIRKINKHHLVSIFEYILSECPKIEFVQFMIDNGANIKDINDNLAKWIMFHFSSNLDENSHILMIKILEILINAGLSTKNCSFGELIDVIDALPDDKVERDKKIDLIKQFLILLIKGGTHPNTFKIKFDSRNLSVFLELHGFIHGYCGWCRRLPAIIGSNVYGTGKNAGGLRNSWLANNKHPCPNCIRSTSASGLCNKCEAKLISNRKKGGRTKKRKMKTKI